MIARTGLLVAPELAPQTKNILPVHAAGPAPAPWRSPLWI
jgi:hypothetical protein